MAWLAAVVTACAGGGDTTIDRTFDPCALAIDTQLPGVTDALALWNIAATPDGDPLAVRFEPAAAAFHGHYDDEHGIVYINEQITEPRTLAIVIAHELGHAFGLEHVSGRTSVMNAGNLATPPTADDLAVTSSCAPPRS